MDHETGKEQISRFIDNELSIELVRPLFRHVSECDECTSFFMRMNTIRDGMRNLDTTPAPELLDKKFAVLGLHSSMPSLLQRTFSVSVSSVILSVGTMFLLTLFMYVVGSYHEESLASQYRQSMPSIIQNHPDPFSKN